MGKPRAHALSDPTPRRAAVHLRYSFYDTYVNVSFLGLASVIRLTRTVAELARLQNRPHYHPCPYFTAPPDSPPCSHIASYP